MGNSMKVIYFIIVSLFFQNLFAQSLNKDTMFSDIYFGFNGGTSFNTLPTAGTTLNFEVKSNLTSKINATFSIGYSTLFDDEPYTVKSYKLVSFDNYSKYYTQLFLADRIKYTIILISLGVNYTFSASELAPFVLFELGYNFSSSLAEGIMNHGIAGTYDTIDEIPSDYRQVAPALDDGSSFNLGIGAGVKYKLGKRTDINIRYVYRYNKAIIDCHQIIIGFTF